MGYSTEGKIKKFWPDDDDTTIWFACSDNLDYIIERAEEKWPGIKIEDLNISAEYVHTNRLGYDLYIPSDYTNFIKVTK